MREESVEFLIFELRFLIEFSRRTWRFKTTRGAKEAVDHLRELTHTVEAGGVGGGADVEDIRGDETATGCDDAGDV